MILIKLLLIFCALALAPLNEEDQKWLDQLTQNIQTEIEEIIAEPYQLFCKDLSKFKNKLENENDSDELKAFKWFLKEQSEVHQKYFAQEISKKILDLTKKFGSEKEERMKLRLPLGPGYKDCLRLETYKSNMKIIEFSTEKTKLYLDKIQEWVALEKQCGEKITDIFISSFGKKPIS